MYSEVFCKVYNEFGWNYYPEIFGEQLIQWLGVHKITPKTSLDLACGTGVLIPDYLERGVSSVTAIDISPEMIRIAGNKFPEKDGKFRLLCGDVETTDVGDGYDAIMVYNAFPHFPDPVRLIRHLSGLLRTGGTLTIAHGASRKVIDAHHLGPASKVSNGLMPAEELAEIFSSFLKVTLVISDDQMYQVTGVR